MLEVIYIISFWFGAVINHFLVSLDKFMLCFFLNEDLKMDEDFKRFLLKKKISEEKYDGMTGELQFKWSELFEKSKPQGKLFIHYILCLWFGAVINHFIVSLDKFMGQDSEESSSLLSHLISIIRFSWILLNFFKYDFN